MSSPYCTIDEAAAILGVHRTTIHHWLGAGQIPGVKLSGIWRLHRSILTELEKLSLQGCPPDRDALLLASERAMMSLDAQAPNQDREAA